MSKKSKAIKQELRMYSIVREILLFNTYKKYSTITIHCITNKILLNIHEKQETLYLKTNKVNCYPIFKDTLFKILSSSYCKDILQERLEENINQLSFYIVKKILKQILLHKGIN